MAPPGVQRYEGNRKHKEEAGMDKASGKAKEAYGAVTGDEAKKAEGRAEQTKAQAAEEAKKREKTRQVEAEAKRAEKERDRHRRKDKGPLGGLTDGLTGR